MKKRRKEHWPSDVFCFVYADSVVYVMKNVEAYRRYKKDKQIASLPRGKKK